MKKCTNCSAQNDDQATQCTQCKMNGSLVPFEQRVDISSIAPKKKNCGNCGKETSIQAEKCIHCRFPIKFLETIGVDHKNIRNFKTGTL